MSLASRTAQQGDPDLLTMLVGILSRHIDAKPHYIVGIALWALHTHVYRRWDKSPRLAILSPVKNCGKSTVLNILGAMVWNGERLIDPTVSSTFRQAGNHTLLLDEVDNMPIVKGMKAILNDGHSIDGKVPRTETVDGVRTVVYYPIYGPVALAGIGRLPAQLMSRSLVVYLHRSNERMERFIPSILSYVDEIALWAATVNLNLDPPMPPQLIGRDADKWRPLIAVAASLGHAELGYRTAADFFKEGETPDLKESVLRDIHTVFDKTNAKVLTNETLYEMLLKDEDGDLEIDYAEQKITKNKITSMMRDFQIEKRIHRHRHKVAKCWHRGDFEEMWERYA